MQRATGDKFDGVSTVCGSWRWWWEQCEAAGPRRRKMSSTRSTSVGAWMFYLYHP